MANVRCPICGKINTPEAGVCAFCGMRLSPDRPGASDYQGEPADGSGEDWLSGLRLEDQADAVPGHGGQAEAESPGDLSNSETPDWLSRIRERARFETDESSAQGDAEDETPDWMAGLEAGNIEQDAGTGGLSSWFENQADPENQAVEPAESMPSDAGAQSEPAAEEWVNELSSWQANTAEGPAADESSEPGELPEWLGMEGDAPVEQAPEQPLLEPTPPGVESAAEEPAAVEGAEVEPSEETIPTVAPSFEEETPDWLRDFSSQAVDESDDAVLPLIETAGLEAHEGTIEPGVVFAAAELPEWLSEEGDHQVDDQAVEKVGEPAEEELARAEMPEWVKEMRPIESVLPGEVTSVEPNQLVEQAGPLAGLRGVLPIEDLSTHYRRPPVYSAKLRLSEKQHSHASLLESIISQESQPLLIPRERSRAPQVLARILVTLLILAVLVLVRIFPIGLVPGPLLAPPELDDMYNQIERIGEQNAPVLLAVDYEPGRFGEMYFTSLPVIEHLMAKNARIVVLSTVPAGPALAQRLIEEAAVDLNERTGQSFAYAAQTLNLGYLPGGTISLLEFAQLPSRAAPATLEGDFEIWNRPFLQNVKDLSGFSQVIVLTDSAETGRAWIEQVKPLMGSAPLFMVTSAQAAPLLMPYVQSQQINGMVSGFLGGVTYGQWRRVDTPASVYWESYQVGVLLAVGVILIGGLFSLVKAMFSKKDKGGE